MTAGRQVRNQHVDCGGKTPNGFLAFGNFQVDPHALLATVELLQDGVQSAGVRAGSTCAHIEASDRISCLRMFDLDDLGPDVGQHCAGRWSCNPMRKSQDFHVFQTRITSQNFSRRQYGMPLRPAHEDLAYLGNPG